MRVFGKDGKVNFIDRHDMYVGFDMEQLCCENFSWVITKEKPELNKYTYEDAKLSEEELERYWFDGQYLLQYHDGNGEQNAAVFMLHKQITTYSPNSSPKIYLVLLNSHNGYYSHGFEVKKKEEIIHKGSI